MSKKKRVVIDHDAEFRKQAGKLVIEEKVKVCQATKDLGFPASTLLGCVRRFRNGTWSLDDPAANSSGSRSDQPDPTYKLPSSSQKKNDQLSQLESKNKELEAKVRRLTMEREILKKAMAY